MSYASDMFVESPRVPTMTESHRQKLREIVEDVHEEMMRTLVDAPPKESNSRHPPLEARLAECGFDGTVATASSFRAVCTRLLAADAADEAAVGLIEACLRSPAPDATVRNLERYLENTSSPSVFLSTMLAAEPVLHLVTTVFGSSQYLSDILVRQPGTAYWLMEQKTWDSPDTAESFEAWFEHEAESFRTIEGKLNAVRRRHREALLKIGVLDLVSGAPVEEVTRRLSDLAEAVARVVLEIVMDEFTGDVGPRGLAVIAMGKLGGLELNYSSDIDLIFISDDADDDTMQLYTKVARRFTDALSKHTEEGYLYRVDLRLRPDGKAGPLVNSETSMRLYYENRGRPWEFQALLKARAIAGDIDRGRRVLDSLSKLMFNPSLPYSPLESVAAMRGQIRENIPVQQRSHNIKLTVGGIRDIEFVAQSIQLMHGQGHPELRTPNTLEALSRIRQLGLLKLWEADNLTAAYRFFRLVEHRLQMMHQLQTHTLPETDADIALLARRLSQGPLGTFTTESFLETLSRHLNNVRTFADSFFAGEAVHPHSALLMLPEDSERAVSIVRQYGIEDVGRVIRTLHAMAYGSFPRLLDRRAREAFEAFLPLLLEHAAAMGDPELTLVNVAHIAAAGKSEEPFYRMLADNDAVRRLVLGIAGMSSMLTRELCGQVGSLDSLLERGDVADEILANVPEWERFSAKAARKGGAAADEQRARQRGWFERLRLHLFAGCLQRRFQDWPHGATGACARAKAARIHLAAAFDEVVPERENVALFALGSYAVGEPRISSDVDLLVVADGVDLADLTQRVQTINQWFTDGRLLKLDFRLRAEGTNAPLVQDFAFYDDYFSRRASLWERVAFAKCAAWGGGDGLLRRFQGRVRAFVANAFTRDEVEKLVGVRRRVESLAPNRFVAWETKRSAGGRYDIEYLTAIGLAAGAVGDDYLGISTEARLDRLAASGFVSVVEREACLHAVELFSLVDHLMELHEITQPASVERAHYLSRYMDRTFEFLEIPAAGGVERLLEEAKAAVRTCLERVVASGKARRQ